MTSHSQEHEVWLAEVLAGERHEPELAARLALCAECRAGWERLRAVGARLEAAGLAQRAHVAELAGEPPARDEERVLALLERFAPPAPPRRLPWRGWLLGVAALLLALLLGLRLFGPRLEPAPVVLGAQVELLAPLGGTPDFARFAWTYDEEAARFDVRVYAADGDRPAGLLHTEPSLRTSTWIPAPQLFQSWPSRIVWQIDAYDDFGRPLGSGEGLAWLSSR